MKRKYAKRLTGYGLKYGSVNDITKGLISYIIN